MPFHERLALTHFVPGKLLISETPDDLRRMCLYIGCLPKCVECRDWTHPMYFDTVLKAHLCLRCQKKMPLLNLTQVTQKYHVTKDDLDFAGIPCHEVPSPYFKHVPMQLYYESMVELNLQQMLDNRQACLAKCRELRAGQKQGIKNKKRELKERTMRDSIKVVAKERAKLGLAFDSEAIASHPVMKRYLDGKEEKVGLRQLITRIEAEIKREAEAPPEDQKKTKIGKKRKRSVKSESVKSDSVRSESS